MNSNKGNKTGEFRNNDINKPLQIGSSKVIQVSNINLNSTKKDLHTKNNSSMNQVYQNNNNNKILSRDESQNDAGTNENKFLDAPKFYNDNYYQYLVHYQCSEV